MNEYSFIVEFDEISEYQINKLWEYLENKNIKFHVLKDEDLKNENQQKEFIEYLENEKNRLAKECGYTYEGSLGKLLYVNEDIFNEVNRILSKYKEIIGGDNNE